MLSIIVFMLCGIAIGYIFRNRNFTQKTERTISLTIVALLFILGLSIGANENIVNNLSVFGRQAAILSLFGLGGSILTSWLVYHFLFKKGEKV